MATRQLTVTARPHAGFRRAGRHWPADATTVDARHFSDAQIAALKNEPNLVVHDTGEGQSGGGQDAGGGQDKGNQGKGNQGQQQAGAS